MMDLISAFPETLAAGNNFKTRAEAHVLCSSVYWRFHSVSQLVLINATDIPSLCGLKVRLFIDHGCSASATLARWWKSQCYGCCWVFSPNKLSRMMNNWKRKREGLKMQWVCHIKKSQHSFLRRVPYKRTLRVLSHAFPKSPPLPLLSFSHHGVIRWIRIRMLPAERL